MSAAPPSMPVGRRRSVVALRANAASLKPPPTKVPEKSNGTPVLEKTQAPLPKPHKQNQMSQAQKDMQQRDMFRLRYLRFKSKDLEKTTEFYTTFGMTLEFETDQESVVPPPSQHHALEKAISNTTSNAASVKTGPNSNLKRGSIANLKDIKVIPPVVAPKQTSAVTGRFGDEDAPKGLGTTVSRVIGLSFADHSSSESAEKLYLIFDEVPEEIEEEEEVENEEEEELKSGLDVPEPVPVNPRGGPAQKSPTLIAIQTALTQFKQIVKQHQIDKMAAKGIRPRRLSHTNAEAEEKEREEAKKRKALLSSSTHKAHRYEYMVIYVHFIQRIAKRLQSKGFRVSPLMDIEGSKMMICEDPNGIQVRLLELSEAQLNETSKKSQVLEFQDSGLRG